MRLVIAEGPGSLWARLEPETPDEMMALEACAARGEWTNGRGAEAIVVLHALADRLGFPVGDPIRQTMPFSPPPRMVVVQRGEPTLYDRRPPYVTAGATNNVSQGGGYRAGYLYLTPAMLGSQHRDALVAHELGYWLLDHGRRAEPDVSAPPHVVGVEPTRVAPRNGRQCQGGRDPRPRAGLPETDGPPPRVPAP